MCIRDSYYYYWLGLDKLYRLMQLGSVKLRVEVSELIQHCHHHITIVYCQFVLKRLFYKFVWCTCLVSFDYIQKHIIKLRTNGNADNVINWQITISFFDNRTSLNLLLDNITSQHCLHGVVIWAFRSSVRLISGTGPSTLRSPSVMRQISTDCRWPGTAETTTTTTTITTTTTTTTTTRVQRKRRRCHDCSRAGRAEIQRAPIQHTRGRQRREVWRLLRSNHVERLVVRPLQRQPRQHGHQRHLAGRCWASTAYGTWRSLACWSNSTRKPAAANPFHLLHDVIVTVKRSVISVANDRIRLRWTSIDCTPNTTKNTLNTRGVATGGISVYIPPNQSTLNFLFGCFVRYTPRRYAPDD